jgi:hypothetical protein
MPAITLADASAIEVILRITAALVLSYAFFYLLGNLWLGRLRPVPVWLYLTVVLLAKALFRWLVVALLFEDQWPAGWSDWVNPLVQPVNQSLYICMGIAVTLLVYAHVRGRATHYDAYHAGDDDDD